MQISLHRIIQEFRNAHDFNESLLILVQRIREALDTEACSLFLVDKHASEFVLLATKGLSAKQVGLVRAPLNIGVIGFVGQRKEAVNISDESKHPAFFHVPALGEDNYKGYLGVPIIYQRRLLGVLVLQKQERKKFPDAEEAFLITLAAQIAEEIARAESAGLISQFTPSEDLNEEALYTGTASSSGVGIGVGVVIFPLADLDAVPDRHVEGDEIAHEIHLFQEALEAIRADITTLSKRLEANLSAEDKALFDAYLHMLSDESLGDEVEQEIRGGQWAQGALRSVVKSHVRQFQNMENEYLRERANDIKDIGLRILAHLQSTKRNMPDSFPEKIVLIGEDIAAANLAEVPVGQLAGVVSGKGSSNSHVAILARALGVPAVMGASDLVLPYPENKTVIVDGYYGHVYVSPDKVLLREFKRLAEEERQMNEDLNELQALPAETTDNHVVSLLVNAGLDGDVGLSLSVGAEGVGLYRTEMPFLVRDFFPSVEEQRKIYRQLLAAFAPRPVTIRTLDVGGDKALPYFPITEENPYLGWRGMRIALDHPEIFLSQVRAMLRANESFSNLKIMLPMITDITEIDEALELIKTAYQEVLEDGLQVEMPDVGVMIEVPSAVYHARQIAKRVQFVSVGSNDLTQYILAVDRNNSRVAPLYNSLHPAVLHALDHVVKEVHKENKTVSICGEMAGDPVAVLLLVGMGFDALSMSASRIARIKWVIRQFSYEQMQRLVDEILEMENSVSIRNHLEEALENAGLGGLIRAGRY